MITALILLASGFAAILAQTPDSRIRLNSVGFVPGFPKIASIAAEDVQLAVVRNSATDGIVHRAVLSVMENTDTRETLTIADFSEFTVPGRYYLFVTGVGRSPDFVIGEDAFTDVYRALMLGMYLWRCGSPEGVNASFGGNVYRHAACHLQDGDLRHSGLGLTGRRDGVGGWHDAGDYNKYTVNSGVTVGLMLKAWEHFSHVLNDIPLHPVGIAGAYDTRFPQLLAEVKWNLDWVAKMQITDCGKVSHKLSTLNFGGNILPERETATRFFAPWSTAATGSFAAMLAQAARLYAPYDRALADSYLAMAQVSYRRMMDTTYVRHTQEPFTTGEYGISSGAEANIRAWAAAEMWETTGEQEYLEELERRISPGTIIVQTEWANVPNLASLTYLNSGRSGRNPELVATMTQRLITVADGIVRTAREHGYGRTFGTTYYWGANGAVASTAFVLNMAYRVTGDETYRHAIQDALSHLLGRNYYGRSYVTRVGFNPPRNPHCRRTASQGITWPGYLIGGPHNSKQGDPPPPANIMCNLGAICWFDDPADYWTNEIAINWNSAMIYATASMLPGSGMRPAPCYPGQPECDGFVAARHTPQARSAGVQPRVRTSRLVQVGGGRAIDIPHGARIYTLDGRLVAHRRHGDAMPVLARSGVYILRMDNSGR
jgi:endoglucanase